MQADLAQLAREWIAVARRECPAALSPAGDAVLIDGGPFYAFYVRHDGVLLQWDYDWGDELREVHDPDTQDLALRAGTRRRPELASMMTPRPTDADACPRCAGSGWEHVADVRIVCQPCAGRGWRSRASPPE